MKADWCAFSAASWQVARSCNEYIIIYPSQQRIDWRHDRYTKRQMLLVRYLEHDWVHDR